MSSCGFGVSCTNLPGSFQCGCPAGTIYLSIDLSIYLSIYPYKYSSLSIRPSIYLSIYIGIYLSIYLSIYSQLVLESLGNLSIYLSIDRSNLSIHPTIYLSTYLSTYLPIYLSTYLGSVSVPDRPGECLSVKVCARDDDCPGNSFCNPPDNVCVCPEPNQGPNCESEYFNQSVSQC